MAHYCEASPGWYVEVCDAKGRDIVTGPACATVELAVEAAKAYLRHEIKKGNG